MKKRTLILFVIGILFLSIGYVIAETEIIKLTDKFVGDNVYLDKRTTINTEANAKNLQEVCEKSRVGTNYLSQDIKLKVYDNKGLEIGYAVLESGTSIPTCWIEG